MKKFTVIAIVVVMMVVGSLILPDFLSELKLSSLTVKAEDSADWQEEDLEDGSGTGTGGSASQDYLILEIVPYKGMGEMGYLVGGQEPIDESYMTYGQTYDFWFTDNSIDKYYSYDDEFMNPSGTFIKTGTTVTYQTGYYKQVKFGYDSGANLYKVDKTGFSYRKVESGTGDFKAVLDVQDSLVIYGQPTTGGTLTNKKNVKAYFVKKPTELNLYDSTTAFYPSCVTEVEDLTGDYDYDPITETFLYNSSHKGKYHVMFSNTQSSTNSSGAYYMLDNYEIVTDNSGDYSWSITYEQKQPDSNINDKWDYEQVPISATYQQWSGGQYEWHADVSGPSDALLRQELQEKGSCIENEGTTNEKIWFQKIGITSPFQYTYHVQMVNNEWFKRYNLKLNSEQMKNCNVKVVTMTPTELNMETNRHYVEEANFIYIKMADDYLNYITLYETLNSPEEIAASQVYRTTNFVDNDLDWDNVVTIVEKAAGVRGGRIAVVIKNNTSFANMLASFPKYTKNVTVSSILQSWYVADNAANGYIDDHSQTSIGTTNNMAKLQLMLLQRDVKDFYDQFMNPENPSKYKIRKVTINDPQVSATGSTGSFIRPDSLKSILDSNGDYKENLYQTNNEALYWNSQTFLPLSSKMDGTLLRFYTTKNKEEIQEVRSYAMDDGHTLWKIKEGHELTTAEQSQIKPNDVVIWYRKLADSDELSDYITLYNFDVQGYHMISSNVISFGPGLIISGSTYDDDITLHTSASGMEYIKAQMNDSGSTGFTLADIISVVTNNGAGYGDTGTETGEEATEFVRVLNIEPTADFSESEAKIQEFLSEYRVKIVSMTSTEFNECIEDINTQYDLIYFGDSAGRFNLNSADTVYNNNALFKNVYHTGDTIITSEGEKQYIGNDLTQQMTAALKEFLDAGYPIVVTHSIYDLSTSKVQSSSNLYQWISSIKGNPAYTNFIDTDLYSGKNSTSSTRINFLALISAGLAVERPNIHLIRPDADTLDEIHYVNQLDLAIMIWPNGVVADSSYRYKSYTYLDLNGDSILTEDERLNADTYGQIESKNKLYFFGYDISTKNGAYMWKILVVKQSIDAEGNLHDTPIRSEITGIVAVNNVENIKILQITDNAGTDDLNCSLQNRSHDTTSQIYKYGGFGSIPLNDYTLSFDTMTVSQFLQQYTAEPYTVATNSTTNKLAGYHLLILDNQVDAITDEKGALANIKNEISNGIGVIFTRGSVNSTTQDDYLTAENRIFLDQRPYTRLNFLALPSVEKPYYNFNYNVSGYTGLLGLDNTYHTQYITKINSGVDKEYPYKLADGVKISNASYLCDAAVAYDSSSSAPLIGWYCLSDSRSPVVRENGLVSDTENNLFTGIYSSSPNDVQNNYYLFNKGKVYYQNIILKDADVPSNDNEIKLFINTIVATYKTSERTASIPAKITIIEPIPVSDQINLDAATIGSDTEVAFTFTIEDSSSDVNLSVLWADMATVEGDWNQKVYAVGDGGVLTAVTNLNEVPNGKYLINIPVTALEGSHKLTIQATNQEGTETKLDTTVVYSATPLSVEITNEDIVKNVDKGEQYLYIDIDYADESNYLTEAEPIRLEFTIENASDLVSVLVTDTNGDNIGVLDNMLYPTAGGAGYNLNDKIVPSGSYYVLLPTIVMSGVSSEEVTITAKLDDAVKGSSTVILLRRSLFQLD